MRFQGRTATRRPESESDYRKPRDNIRNVDPVVTMRERAEATLQRLKDRLPNIFSAEWLDSRREDLAQVLDELGPTAVNKDLSISLNSLDYWRRRRGLTERRGRDPSELRLRPSAGGVETIDSDLIDDNPS